jgi:hypothetical protein
VLARRVEVGLAGEVRVDWSYDDVAGLYRVGGVTSEIVVSNP